MSASNEAVCRTCGACCAYSATWPRFGLETEAEIAMIPREYVDDARGTMRCIGDRCAALAGEIGVMTTCTLYALRPQVCRACEPGDESCAIAREYIGLPPVKPLAFEAP